MKKTLYFALQRIAALVCRVFGSGAPQANRANPRGGVALMANEEDGDEAEGSRIVGLANAFQATADDWIQLAPMGDHPHGQYVQRVNTQTVAKLVANFRAEAAKSGQSFAGKPFYIGHPDVPHLANQFPDKKAYGWVMDMAGRSDGLYAQVKWSETGRKLLENAHYKFLSPYWALEAERGSGPAAVVAKPVELISVGLTNAPRIKGALPLANEKENDMHKKLAALAVLLTLANDASPEAVAEAAEARIKTLDTEKTTLANEKTGLEQKLGAETTAKQTAEVKLANVTTERDTVAANFKKERSARIPLLLDNALLSGRITIAERAGYQVKLENEATFDATAAEIAGKAPNVHTQSATRNLGNQKIALANEQERRERVQELVTAEMAKGVDYSTAFSRVRQKNSELFGQMHDSLTK